MKFPYQVEEVSTVYDLTLNWVQAGNLRDKSNNKRLRRKDWNVGGCRLISQTNMKSIRRCKYKMCKYQQMFCCVNIRVPTNGAAQPNDFVQMWPKSIILYTCDCFLLFSHCLTQHNICPLTIVTIDLYWQNLGWLKIQRIQYHCIDWILSMDKEFQYCAWINLYRNIKICKIS